MAGRSCSLQAEPGRKGPKGWRGRLRKNQQKAQPAHPPPLSLWSSNSLILNLRLPPPPQPTPPPSHPILTTQTHTHAQFMQLPLAPFLSSQSHEWPDGDKTQQQPPQEVQPLGVGTERRILSDPLLVPLTESVCVLTINHMSCDRVCVVHLVPHD